MRGRGYRRRATAFPPASSPPSPLVRRAPLALLEYLHERAPRLDLDGVVRAERRRQVSPLDRGRRRAGALALPPAVVVPQEPQRR